MAYESWREQVEEGEQKGRDGEIGSVFLFDRGKQQRFPYNVADDGLSVLFVCLTVDTCPSRCGLRHSYVLPGGL